MEKSKKLLTAKIDYQFSGNGGFGFKFHQKVLILLYNGVYRNPIIFPNYFNEDSVGSDDEIEPKNSIPDVRKKIFLEAAEVAAII